MTSKAERLRPTSTPAAPRGTLLRMSTARADHQEHDPEDEAGGVILSPEEEAELERVIAETDEAERAGRVIPLDRFLAERGMG
jgi:hypothetical protein